jgi:LacI family transcriptional regulator
MAKTLGYRPNRAARVLSSNRPLRISINLPSEIALFWDGVREGIQKEAAALAGTAIEIEFRSFPRLASGEKQAFQDAMNAKVNGIILATGRAEELRLAIRDAARQRIPVVAVSADAPKTARLAVVSIDSSASGSLAGELLGRFLRGAGKLAIITGDLAITDHADKFKSFTNSVQTLFPSMEVVPVLQNHEDESQAYEDCKGLLHRHSDLSGIYISTANSTSVLQALKDFGRLGKLPVIATDLFPSLIDHLQAGHVIATLYQRPHSQGQLALRLLYNFLIEGLCPSHQIKLTPHLIMKSNLSFFLERISSEFLTDDSNGLPSGMTVVQGQYAAVAKKKV